MSTCHKKTSKNSEPCGKPVLAGSKGRRCIDHQTVCDVFTCWEPAAIKNDRTPATKCSTHLASGRQNTQKSRTKQTVDNSLFTNTPSTSYKPPVVQKIPQFSMVKNESMVGAIDSLSNLEIKNENDFMDVCSSPGGLSEKLIVELQLENQELKNQITRLQKEQATTQAFLKKERDERLSIANQLQFISSGVPISKNNIPKWAKKRSQMPYFGCSFDVFMSWRKQQPKHLEYETIEEEWNLLPETSEKVGPYSKTHFSEIYRRYIEHMDCSLNKQDSTDEYSYVDHNGTIQYSKLNEYNVQQQTESDDDLIWLPDISPEVWLSSMIEEFLLRKPRHVYLDPTLVGIEGVRRFFRNTDCVQYLCKFSGYKTHSSIITLHWIRKTALKGNQSYSEIIRQYDLATASNPIEMGYFPKDYPNMFVTFGGDSFYDPNDPVQVDQMRRSFDKVAPSAKQT